MAISIGKLKDMNRGPQAELKAEGLGDSNKLLAASAKPSDLRALVKKVGAGEHGTLELARRQPGNLCGKIKEVNDASPPRPTWRAGSTKPKSRRSCAPTDRTLGKAILGFSERLSGSRRGNRMQRLSATARPSHPRKPGWVQAPPWSTGVKKTARQLVLNLGLVMDGAVFALDHLAIAGHAGLHGRFPGRILLA